MANPVFVTADRTDDVGNGASIVLNKPSGLADGNWLFAVVGFRTPATVTPPSGWTMATYQTDYIDLRIYIRYVATASGEPSNYTWGSGQSALERKIGHMWRVTDADASTFADVIGTNLAYAANRTAFDLPQVDPTATQGTLFAIAFSSRAGATPPEALNVPSGMTGLSDDVSVLASNNNSLRIATFRQNLSSGSPTGVRSFTLGSPAAGTGGFMLVVKPAVDGAPTPAVTRAWVGLPSASTVRLLSLTTNVVTGVRMAVSTSSGMTSPSYSSSQVPDAQGYAKHSLGSLTAFTDYYMQLELDGVLTGPICHVKTHPASTYRGPFSFLAFSCRYNGNHAVWTAMKDRVGLDGTNALFAADLGDVHYDHASYQPVPIAPNDVTDHRTSYETSLQGAAYKAFAQVIGQSHTWSDNDFCGSNSDGTAIGRPAAITVRHQVMVDPPLDHAEAIYRDWKIGKFHFIQTDLRSMSSAKGATDNSSKTYMGTDQKTWFKAKLLETDAPIKIWLADNMWDGTPVTNGTVDNWQAYSTERTELQNYITDHRVILVYIHGDSHSLHFDTGVNNPLGGFPTIGVAPVNQQAQAWSYTASNGSWPPSTQEANVYGWFDVIDDGTTLHPQLQYRGMDVNGTVRVNGTITFNLPPTLTEWNGTVEGPVTIEGVYNGTIVETTGASNGYLEITT